ncbi:TonB-dependent siderophore receptor [Caulobacter sp. S45]|uniref:TonB-dependent receptor n=1 Tax=Caulobacter sp. S45 TaxID=1641861 RepID=UPI001575DF86|nr:TonB-dependent receptor [Caulobacter sp. S45]
MSRSVTGDCIAAVVLAGLAASAGIAAAQDAPTATRTPVVTVTGRRLDSQGYAAPPQYDVPIATLGPLGDQPILDAPQSVTVIPEDLVVNQQTRNVNDTLRFLPSVEIRDQQGFEISRPQSRGFQSSIASNTRLDGLNIIGTTEVPAENLAGIQVLNGPSGSLFGPETPAGVFDYILKRPTDAPLLRYVEGFDSNGVFTEQADVGGRGGPDDKLGARLNLLHGQGEAYVEGSHVDRTLATLDVDYHLDERTVVEADYSHYSSDATGLPGSFVYDGASSGASKSTLLPKAVDPSRVGYGQPGAGTEISTETALGKIKHSFNSDWNFEVGGLYQNAIRGLYGVTNTLTDDKGDYTVTKNFTAVPQFTIGSNSAALDGHIRLFGLLNDVSVGTNGFINGQYSHKTSIAVTLTGKGQTLNLADPLVLPNQPTPQSGGLYQSSRVFEQSLVFGDTLHFNDQLALQGVVSTSFLHSHSYAASGALTSQDKRDGVTSPTVSLIYKPLAALSFHATYASSLEQGDQAPTNVINANQILAPYKDELYEVGAKYAVTRNLLLTLDAFHMTRPFATTPLKTFEVIGEQRNTGVEAFVQGEITPDLSLFGGATYIDARLLDSGNATTQGRLIVGVPSLKSDLVFDYHPAFAQGLAATFTVNYEDRRAATNTNSSFAPSYVTIDPGLRYSLGLFGHHATARVQAINVTDEHYYISIADGAIVGSPGANTAYLGMPRTYEASLEFDF